MDGRDLARFVIYGHNRFHNGKEQEVYQVGGLRNRLKVASIGQLRCLVDQDLRLRFISLIEYVRRNENGACCSKIL